MTSWQHILKQIGNLIIPPQCPGCHQLVSAAGICGGCWPHIKRITPPACIQCGRGFGFDAGVSRCGRCLTQPPDFDLGMAAVRYNAMSKRLILGLKYGGRHDVTPILGRMMANRVKRTGLFLCLCIGHAIMGADITNPLNWHGLR